MANYNNLKTAIQDVIKENGYQEIKGDILQNALLSMINSLGAGYQFVSVATPETNPGTPDQKVFYIANGKGTYVNFGGLVVDEDEVVLLVYDDALKKLLSGIASNSKLTELVGGLLPLSTNFLTGKYYDTRGNLVTNAGSKYTDKIDISSIKKMVINGSFEDTTRSTIFYDKNGSILDHIEERQIVSGQEINVEEFHSVAFSCLATSSMSVSIVVDGSIGNLQRDVDSLKNGIEPILGSEETSKVTTSFNFNLMDVDIKSGDVFSIRMNVESFTRIIVCYNGANANRLLDTTDTSLANKWIDFVAPTDLTSIGIGYLQPSTNISLSCKIKGRVEKLEDSMGQGNVLYGKKWVACGDSFTHGDFSNSPTNDYTIREGRYAGQFKVYPFLIGNRNGMTIVNEAINGSTMAFKDGNRYEFSTTNGRYTQIPDDADYITLKFGINDDSAHANIPIGTIDDATNTTFYGAWNIVMDYLIRNHPQAKIGIIVTNGSTIPYVEATIAIAKKWGIPYLNEATDNQCSFMFRSLRADVLESVKTFRNNQWFVDADLNNHPNAKAHEFESSVVEAWLRTL